MVDRNLIGRKLAEMDIYLSQIGEYTGISVTAYKKDWRSQRIIERTLQILIETCIDIANHLIADRRLRMPQTYADTFQVLTENKLITKSLSGKMKKIVKFRNIIVHQYEKVNPDIVVSILRKHLTDFERFRKEVIKVL